MNEMHIAESSIYQEGGIKYSIIDACFQILFDIGVMLYYTLYSDFISRNNQYYNEIFFDCFLNNLIRIYFKY